MRLYLPPGGGIDRNAGGRGGKRWVALAILVFALSWGRAASADSSRRHPNIIVFLADDLGYGDLSCYGNRAYSTPRLDRLAGEGMRFLDFHSSGAVSSPTRAGFLTGRYQQRAGIPGVIYAGFDQNRHHGLQARETTLAEVLKQAGYATGIVGSGDDSRPRLFYLATDLAEHRDVSSAYPGRVRSIQGALNRWYGEVTAHATRQPEQ